MKLPSLKIFRLEFPDETEPDFDINTYSQESYKLRNNSITEIKNCYQVFKNLEEIQQGFFPNETLNKSNAISFINTNIDANFNANNPEEYKIAQNIKRIFQRIVSMIIIFKPILCYRYRSSIKNNIRK